MTLVTVRDIREQLEGYEDNVTVGIFRKSPDEVSYHPYVAMHDVYKNAAKVIEEQKAVEMRKIGITHGEFDNDTGICHIYEVWGNDIGERDFCSIVTTTDKGLVAEIADTVARMNGFNEIEYFDETPS